MYMWLCNVLVSARVCMCRYVCILVEISVVCRFVYVCMYVCMYVCVCVCVCPLAYVSRCVSIVLEKEGFSKNEWWTIIDVYE